MRQVSLRYRGLDNQFQLLRGRGTQYAASIRKGTARAHARGLLLPHCPASDLFDVPGQRHWTPHDDEGDLSRRSRRSFA